MNAKELISLLDSLPEDLKELPIVDELTLEDIESVEYSETYGDDSRHKLFLSSAVRGDAGSMAMEIMRRISCNESRNDRFNRAETFFNNNFKGIKNGDLFPSVRQRVAAFKCVATANTASYPLYPLTDFLDAAYRWLNQSVVFESWLRLPRLKVRTSSNT